MARRGGALVDGGGGCLLYLFLIRYCVKRQRGINTDGRHG